MTKRHGAVKVNAFTLGLIAQLQKHYEDVEGIKVSKTTLLQKAVTELHKIKMPR